MIYVITGEISADEIKDVIEDTTTKNAEDFKNEEDYELLICPEAFKHPNEIVDKAIEICLNDDEEKSVTVIITFSPMLIEAIDVICTYALDKHPVYYLKDKEGLSNIHSNYIGEIFDNLCYGYDRIDWIKFRKRLPSNFQEKTCNCCEVE